MERPRSSLCLLLRDSIKLRLYNLGHNFRPICVFYYRNCLLPFLSILQIQVKRKTIFLEQMKEDVGEHLRNLCLFSEHENRCSDRYDTRINLSTVLE